MYPILPRREVRCLPLIEVVHKLSLHIDVSLSAEWFCLPHRPRSWIAQATKEYYCVTPTRPKMFATEYESSVIQTMCTHDVRDKTLRAAI